ncbi:MAG: hypothetical protein ACOH1Y_17325 [Propionicimonas sp.]
MPTSARTDLLKAITEHLASLDGLDPDRFTLSDVIVELGVASARTQLDRVPAHLMRAAAGIRASSFQVRLSQSELDALHRLPNLPMNLEDAFGQHPEANGRSTNSN